MARVHSSIHPSIFFHISAYLRGYLGPFQLPLLTQMPQYMLSAFTRHLKNTYLLSIASQRSSPLASVWNDPETSHQHLTHTTTQFFPLFLALLFPTGIDPQRCYFPVRSRCPDRRLQEDSDLQGLLQLCPRALSFADGLRLWGLTREMAGSCPCGPTCQQDTEADV